MIILYKIFIRNFKDAILSLYFLFYKINKGAWPKDFDFDNTKSSALVTFIFTIYITFLIDLVRAYLKIEDFLKGYKLYVFVIMLCVIGFIFYDKYIFIDKFEIRFREFSSKKKIIFTVTPLLFILGAALIIYLHSVMEDK
jgi:hypothetical protein